MAANCSHQDAERSKVGLTAHFVASLRALEHDRGEGEALFQDPYAALMGGEIGASATASLRSNAANPDLNYLSTRLNTVDDYSKTTKIPLGLMEGVIIRTRRIDDETKEFIRQNTVFQICVLGAGLDSGWQQGCTMAFMSG